MLLLNGIKLPLEHDQLLLADLCAKRLGCPREVLRRVQLLRAQRGRPATSGTSIWWSRRW